MYVHIKSCVRQHAATTPFNPIPTPIPHFSLRSLILCIVSCNAHPKPTINAQWHHGHGLSELTSLGKQLEKIEFNFQKLYNLTNYIYGTQRQMTGFLYGHWNPRVYGYSYFIRYTDVSINLQIPNVLKSIQLLLGAFNQS